MEKRKINPSQESRHILSKIVCCASVLCLGLTMNAALAADRLRADQSGERIGGKAGVHSEEGKLRGLTGETPDRLGGQAGLQGERGKLKGVAGDSSERLG